MTSLCKYEKQQYFKYCISINDMKSVWGHLRSPVNLDLPENIRDVEILSDFFVFKDNENPDPYTLENYGRTSANVDLIPFDFKFVTPVKVGEIIRAIKTDSVGLDGIGIKMIELCGSVILPYITHIVNCCLEQSVFPDLWKVALVRPIPKKTNPSELKDLRPISILPILSKVLEKIMTEQLQEFLSSHDLIPESQSGFRPLHSCGTALLNIKDDILRARDVGLMTILVLFDFSRAFDTINHQLLLAICHHVGISVTACQLLESYLSGRQQVVKIDESQSSFRDITAGVPQGSILGPLLYVLYTRGLPKVFQYCSSHCYADDTQIYCSFSPGELQLACNNINSDIEALLRYASSHCLKINSVKTKVLVFGPGNILEEISSRTIIKVGGIDIRPVAEARNLGLILDSTLRFRSHISQCVRKGYGKLKLLYNRRHGMNKRVRSTVCNALVLSGLNYCDYVYGPSIDARDQRKIQVLQNACLRFIYGIRRRQHISHKLIVNNWLSMTNRRLHHAATLFHRILLFKSPPYLLNKVTFRSDVHNVNIRFGGTVAIPAHRTEAFKSSFTYQISKIYNECVPTELKSMNVRGFKTHFWSFLFQGAMLWFRLLKDCVRPYFILC